MSNEEFDHDWFLAILRPAIGIENPPDVDLVRVIAPADQPEVWEECMRAAGWAVSTTFDGGLSPPEDLPADQAPAYREADYTCHAQYPVDHTMFLVYGDEQIKVSYEFAVEVTRPCLEGLGFSTEEPPSWPAYRSTWMEDPAGGFIATRDTWNPYQAVDEPGVAGLSWEELLTTCPQNPPSELLFPNG